MYGYHPKEQFAIDVGTYLEGRDLGEHIKVLRYTGEQDIPARIDPWTDTEFKPLPNLWKFVKEQGRFDLLVDIHNGRVVKRKEELDAVLTYRTRTPGEYPDMYNKVHEFARSPCYAILCFCETGTPYVPEEIAEIEVELLPPRISRSKARDFVAGLVETFSKD
jgi:hypothetical protein